MAGRDITPGDPCRLSGNTVKINYEGGEVTAPSFFCFCECVQYTKI
jgi:hypothetical protein